ncbi:MAG TPA: dipeptide epimerase [Candidatus Limnocylindrales bacterium]
MSLALTAEVLRLGLRDPFRIARAHAEDAGHRITTVVVELRDEADGPTGPVALGEGYPDAYYGETPATMTAVFPLLLDAIGPFEDDLRGGEPAAARRALLGAASAMDDAIRHHGAAKCALDTALHDLVGQRLGLPVHALLGLSAEIPPTDFTLGLDEPAIVAERAERAARFPALKIKVGGSADLETLEAVRQVYAGPLRVDANTGWEPDAGARLIPELVRLGVELVEQPFKAHRLDQTRWLQERSPLPIVVDESSVTSDDLEGLVGICAGVNVKLAKVGGPGPAARMLGRARELGFRTFLGCMEETSVGIAASAAVASLAEWVDLDGCLLLAEDPFDGLVVGDDCRWRLGDAPGLGVSRRTPIR